MGCRAAAPLPPGPVGFAAGALVGPDGSVVMTVRVPRRATAGLQLLAALLVAVIALTSGHVHSHEHAGIAGASSSMTAQQAALHGEDDGTLGHGGTDTPAHVDTAGQPSGAPGVAHHLTGESSEHAVGHGGHAHARADHDEDGTRRDAPSVRALRGRTAAVPWDVETAITEVATPCTIVCTSTPVSEGTVLRT